MATQTIIRGVLAAEFGLGGAVRLQPQLLPSISDFVFHKANGFFQHLQWIPGQDAKAQTQTVGVMLCVVSAAFVVVGQSKPARVVVTLLGASLSTILLVGEASINGDVWLPGINIIAAAYLLWTDAR